MEEIDPECVLIANPSPNSWKHSIFAFCFEVMKWQKARGKSFVVLTPPDSGFAKFLENKSSNTWYRETIDMSKLTSCDSSIKDLFVYHNQDQYFNVYESKYTFVNEGKLWKDPQ